MGQSSKEELMSVKLDWTFKELMLKEEIRNSFISAVLDFIYLDEKEFFNSFHIRNDKTHKIYTDKMGFYLIELPKIPKEIENISDLLLWAKFINSSSEEEIKMLATKSENIEVAYKELKRLSQDEEKRMEYEARQKAIRDYNHLMYQSKQEGFIEGEKRGFEKGEKKGAYNKAIETAKNFLKLGLQPQIIAEGSGLSIEEINQIQKDMNLNINN